MLYHPLKLDMVKGFLLHESLLLTNNNYVQYFRWGSDEAARQWQFMLHNIKPSSEPMVINIAINSVGYNAAVLYYEN